MGVRSTFVLQESCIKWPDWFVKKYNAYVHFPELKDGGVIASKLSYKTYGVFSCLHEDIQKSVNWDESEEYIVLIWLHKCGGITRVEISKNKINMSVPTSWDAYPYIGHDYCYGCSDYSHADKSLIE